MSYEIVRNLSIKEVDGEFVAVIKSAANNCYPHYYSEWNYGEGHGWNKRKLETEILKDFYWGNLQKGSSRFKKVIDLISRTEYNHFLNPYYRLEKVYTKAWKRHSSLRYRDNRTAVQEIRLKQVADLENKIRQMRDEVLGEILYRFMKDHSKLINRKQVEPFVIIRKEDGAYVTKWTRAHYYTSFFNKPVYHTSANLYYKLTESEWCKERFIVEPISQSLYRRV